MQELKTAIAAAAKKLFDTDIDPVLSRPDEKFGDYSTNAALQLAKKADKTPHEIADKLIAELEGAEGIAQIAKAGPGFINFRLTDETMARAAFSATKLPKPNAGQEILVEFGDPNPFKEMHAGHLYSYIIGESISRLLESTGAKVKRLSYHGDVGLHVAKAIWAMQKDAPNFNDTLGKYYAAGAQAYETDDQAKADIDTVNQQIYDQSDPQINQLHEQGSKLSFVEFDKILELLNISTDKRYLESQTTLPGKQLVVDNTGKVFEQSQGAIIFVGEKAGLHTRVFITSKGIPTYETKDLGLVALKDKDYPDAARSIVITATEQDEYFKVMLAALAEINPKLADKTTHMSHGFLSPSTGKMSSRTGNVYTAWDMLSSVKDAVHSLYPDSEAQKPVATAAVKYTLLKHRMGQDIVVNVKEAVSLDGSSGPYLQYANARARSILAKADLQDLQGSAMQTNEFDKSERSLARKISEYPEVVEKAVVELMPHHVANYLYELAQQFNRFYEASRIIGDEREVIRLKLVKSYQRVLEDGLDLLNIEAPERM